MNIEEAFTILGISKEASVEEIKVRYKTLAKSEHPDINKAATATENFKKINEAYQVAQDFKSGKISENPFEGHGMGFGGFNIEDLFNSFNGGSFRRAQSHQRHINLQPPQVPIQISFEEAVLGCQKNIKYNRYKKCEKCEDGEIKEKNDCKNCNGFGQSTMRQGNVVFQTMCNKCHGKNIKINKCNTCNAEGSINSEISISISVPAGIENGQVLRIQNAGHYIPNVMLAGGFSDAFVPISVSPAENMWMEENDVLSNLNISLLEALKGCVKKVKTLYDKEEIDIEINPLTKHKDEISLSNKGVKGSDGAHRFILNVDYPKNIENLINSLENKNVDSCS